MAEDALWALLGEVTGRDRIEVLIELGNRASARGEFDRAMTYWQQLETTAAQLGDAEAIGMALRLQGVAAFNSHDHQAAAQLYQQAASVYSEAGLSPEAASALWCVADCHRAMGNSQEQLEAAGQSRNFAELDGIRDLAGDACFMQARALWFLDRDEEALAAYQTSRDHYRAAERPDQVAVVDDFAVSVHVFLGNLDEALDLARGCLVLARMSSSDNDDRYARYRLAEVLLRRGDIEEALSQADEALQANRAHDDFAGAAKCEQLRAEALFQRDQLDAALDAFVNARVLFDATGRDVEALRCDTRRAVLLHYAGDFGLAARTNERLVQDYLRVDDPQAARWSVVRWLDNLREAQHFEECVAVAREHMGHWDQAPISHEASYREFLGLYALALESTGDLAEAKAIATDVITRTPAREAGIGMAFCYEVRGRSLLERDETAARQDFSHAIALHLAHGKVDRARELSRLFLPADGPSRSRDDGSIPASGAGHG